MVYAYNTKQWYETYILKYNVININIMRVYETHILLKTMVMTFKLGNPKGANS